MGVNGSNGTGSAAQPRTIVLPESGEEVRLRYVSPLLLNDLRKASQKGLVRPTPPVQVVDGREQENPTHPEYVTAQYEYNLASGQRFIELLFRYGVDNEPDAETIAAFRQQAEADGLDLPADDKVLYVTRLLIGGTGDLEALQEAILGTGHPTEKAVTEKVAGFPPEI